MQLKIGSKILKQLIRLAFFSLFLFEFLNWLGILHFPLDFTWLGLIITSGGAWLGLELISWRVAKYNGRGLSWIIYLVTFAMVFLDAFGDFNRCYTKFFWYDQLGHWVGGGAAGGIIISIFTGLAAGQKIKLGKWGRFISALGIATMFGVFYELEEYLEDVFTGSHRLGDGFDTANDLMLDWLGAAIVCFFGVVFARTKRNLKLF